MSRSRLKIFLPILALILGAGATFAMLSSRQPPQPRERPALGPLVETQMTESADVQVTVRGQGEVSPRVSVDLAPQVAGRVISVHPSLISGGRFRAGTELLRIDPRDYALAVERARAAVAAAETTIERELAEATAATADWRELHGDEEPPALLARTPQIRAARAQLAAAQADLATAELNLERTRLSLPFAGLVIREDVDAGDLVIAGQPVATVYGLDAVEVPLPLDDRELAWFDLPEEGEDGPVAVVSASFAGREHRWQARVERLEGQVDPRSRMVRVVVVVEEPFAESEGRPPLLPGTFVDVEIAGRRLGDVVSIPRAALRSGNQVWALDGDRLRIREVEVLRRERLRVLLGGGLAAGERIVTSSLDAVTDGMTVRIAEGDGRG